MISFTQSSWRACAIFRHSKLKIGLGKEVKRSLSPLTPLTDVRHRHFLFCVWEQQQKLKTCWIDFHEEQCLLHQNACHLSAYLVFLLTTSSINIGGVGVSLFQGCNLDMPWLFFLCLSKTTACQDHILFPISLQPFSHTFHEKTHEKNV